MPASFWVAYAVKLAMLATALAVLYAVARRLKNARLFAPRRHRYATVIESVMLSPHTAVYVLRVGARYLVVGGGAGGIVKLAELAPGELDATPKST